MAEELQRAIDLKNATLAADTEYYMKLAGLDPENVNTSSGTKFIVAASVSDLGGAGTLAKVELILNGTKASSTPLTINNITSFNLQTGETSIHVFEQPELGELLTVDVRLHLPLVTDSLHLRFLVVVDVTVKQVYIFPCYSWISEKTTLRTGKASLIFHETDARLLAQRQSELEERKTAFRWGTNSRYAGFPGYANAEKAEDVPLNVQFADVDKFSFKAAVKQASLKFKLHAFITKDQTIPDFEGFLSKAQGMGNQGDDELVIQMVFNNWTRDEEFGRQFLNGHNPVMLQKFTEIPSKFPVQQVLSEQGLSLSDGELYVADYVPLHDLIPEEDQSPTAFFCAPICLFRLLQSGELVPIAIQLSQNPGPECPIWTPRDGFGWLLAKIYVKNADGQIHQAVTHLMKTHLILEAATTAMWRQLPTAHPIFKFLIPHTRTTIAINTAARQSLINDGGILDVTLSSGVKGAYAAVRRAFDSFKIQDLVFPDAIKARGLDDPKLEKYYYRDDGLRLWRLIMEYVSEIIGIYYSSNEDVARDTELQAWMSEMYTFGFPRASDGGHHGFNESVSTRQELIQLLTIFIFQASAGHASINFSQMAYFGFVPNAPLMLRAAPPTTKNGITMTTLLHSLPRTADVANQLSIMYALSRYSVGEIFLGTFPEIHFSEAAPNEAAKKFKEKLDALSADIEERNLKLGPYSYPYMKPSLVPNSIAK